MLAATTARADNFDLFNPNTGVWWWHLVVRPSVLTDGELDTNHVQETFDFMSCVDADTGHYLDCQFSYSILGLDLGNDPEVDYGSNLTVTDELGGHDIHSNSLPANPQPYIFTPDNATSPIFVVGGVSNATGNFVSGHTNFQVVEFEYGQPEVAGATGIDAVILTPPGYHCIGGCFDRTTVKTHATIVRQVTGLQPLLLNYDPSAANYVVTRDTTDAPPKGDPGHSDDQAVWAQFETINVLLNIASKYKEAVDADIRVNDMSLPHGGLFDIHDDWNENPGNRFQHPHKHQDHRNGQAFDLNTHDSDGNLIPCTPSDDDDPDYTLRGMVMEQNKKADLDNPPPYPLPIALVCEPWHDDQGELHENIHINAFSPSPLQILEQVGAF